MGLGGLRGLFFSGGLGLFCGGGPPGPDPLVVGPLLLQSLVRGPPAANYNNIFISKSSYISRINYSNYANIQ